MKKQYKTLIALGSAILLNSCGIPQEEFEKCNWGIYENYDDIWKEYMGEEIKHNQNSYNDYIFFMDKVNNGERSGKIYAPDLDGNGYIQERGSEGKIIRKINPEKWISGEELFKKLEEK